MSNEIEDIITQMKKRNKLHRQKSRELSNLVQKAFKRRKTKNKISKESRKRNR